MKLLKRYKGFFIGLKLYQIPAGLVIIIIKQTMCYKVLKQYDWKQGAQHFPRPWMWNNPETLS